MIRISPSPRKNVNTSISPAKSVRNLPKNKAKMKEDKIKNP